jgi:hypothetical protein
MTFLKSSSLSFRSFPRQQTSKCRSICGRTVCGVGCFFKFLCNSSIHDDNTPRALHVRYFSSVDFLSSESTTTRYKGQRAQGGPDRCKHGILLFEQVLSERGHRWRPGLEPSVSTMGVKHVWMKRTVLLSQTSYYGESFNKTGKIVHTLRSCLIS